MRRLIYLLLLPATLCGETEVHAVLAIPTVEVGDAGNASDSTGFGSVGYAYNIGKYEVTNAQYTEFLNAVDPAGTNTLKLYDGFMTSNANGGIDFSSGALNGSKYSSKAGRADNAAVFVSWYSALRFANWMHNGQGIGSTETGAYTLGTLTNGVPVNGNITRHPGATWFLPSENEWYKAAYYDANTASYFSYPTKTNATPVSDEPAGGDGGSNPANTANFLNDDGNNANGFNDGFAVTGDLTFSFSENYVTSVGAYPSALGPYGTLDQAGNVAEWTEAFADIVPLDMLERIIRGGHWYSGVDDLSSMEQDQEGPQIGLHTIGFRLAMAAVPEPSPLLLMGLVGTLTGLAHSLAKRRTR